MRCVRLDIDGHKCYLVVVKMDFPEDMSVSPILFAIYLSEIFREVEAELEGCIVISFADDCGWLVTAN